MMAPLTATGQVVVSSNIACLLVAYVFVALRGIVLLRQKKVPYPSDWFVVAATAVYTAYAGIVFAMVYNAEGTIDIEELSPESLIQLLKISFPEKLLTGLAISLAKISLLLFFRSIFVTPLYQKLNSITIGVVIAWFIGTTFTIIFQCNPPSAAWGMDAFNESTECWPLGTIIAGYEASNIVVDLMIIVLPVREVLRLHVPAHKKIGIIFLFVLGGFVILTSCFRIVNTNIHLQAIDQTTTVVNLTNTVLWTNIQLACTIVGTCLPTLAPLIPKCVSKRLQAFSAWLASACSHGWRSSSSAYRSARDRLGSRNDSETLIEVKVGTSVVREQAVRSDSTSDSSTFSYGNHCVCEISVMSPPPAASPHGRYDWVYEMEDSSPPLSSSSANRWVV